MGGTAPRIPPRKEVGSWVDTLPRNDAVELRVELPRSDEVAETFPRSDLALPWASQPFRRPSLHFAPRT